MEALHLFRKVALSYVAATFLFICCVASAPASQYSSASLPNSVMHFPMWSVLPAKRFAILGEGVIKRRRWAIFAFANGRPGASQHPCIEDVTLRYVGGLISINHGEPSCGALAPPNPIPVATEYAFTNVGGVVVGMTLDPSIARVKMDFSTGPDLDVSTKLLSSHQAKKSRLRAFRYVALGLSRKACLEAFQGVSGSGNTIFQTSPQECVL